MILAKPSPRTITLEVHTDNVLREGRKLLDHHPFVQEKYKKLTGRDFHQITECAIRWHDEGKSAKEWQEACRKDYETLCRNPGARATFLQRVNLRHELASLYFAQKKGVNLGDPVEVAIAAHHRKLSTAAFNSPRKPWERLKEFSRFRERFEALGNSALTFEEAIRHRYAFSGPRAFLQIADHWASAAEEGETLPPLRPFSYRFDHPTKNPVQSLAESCWENEFTLLRAPTGAGKTDAALLWAAKQIDNKRADRLVIAMPTRFTSNALAVSLCSDLSEIGLYHSTAVYYRKKLRDQESDDSVRKEQAMARYLGNPVTVSTIDHLLACLTGTREDHHLTFFNFAHSCLVIDEADFYDEFIQENIIVLLRVCALLEMPVLIMSATLPDMSRKLYGRCGSDPGPILTDSSNAELPRCDLRRHASYIASPDQIPDELWTRFLKEPVIVYLNTIQRAVDFYRYILRILPDDRHEQIILYHSRFTEPDKARKETNLLRLLGRNAWEEERAAGIAILTQIGEMSVNISANLMVSDLCPIDRLTQRIGRLSRFGGGPGDLLVIEPGRRMSGDDVGLYPAPYGEPPSPGQMDWIPSPAMAKTKELLKPGRYSPKDLLRIVNKVYPSNVAPSARSVVNREALERAVVQNWLILPQLESVEGEDESWQNWRSRDIDPQAQIVVAQNRGIDGEGLCFASRSAFREFLLENSVSVPLHMRTLLIEKGLVESVTVLVGASDEEMLHFASSICYSFSEGFNLPE